MEAGKAIDAAVIRNIEQKWAIITPSPVMEPYYHTRTPDHPASCADSVLKEMERAGRLLTGYAYIEVDNSAPGKP